MSGIINWLKGKKTYLISGVTMLVGLLQLNGFVTDKGAQWITTMILGLLGLSIRAGINNAVAAQNESAE